MNKVYRKTIKIFLIDGMPTGRMSAELSNWTGKAYKIPRNKIKESKDRSDLNGAGVYFLLGKDDEGHQVTYIGEAEDVLRRLNYHLREKDFWTEVIVLVSKDDNLNKAHIKYLEHHFYQLAIRVGRYKLANENVPTLPVISESDGAEMEEFMANSMLLVGTLGHKIFEETISDNEEINHDRTFYIRAARGADANMIQTSEGFVVMEGSKFANPVANSFPTTFQNIREQLLEDGKLEQNGDELLLVRNHIFSSPSTAAATVMGRNANGLTEWKLANGLTLRDVESFESQA